MISCAGCSAPLQRKPKQGAAPTWCAECRKQRDNERSRQYRITPEYKRRKAEQDRERRKSLDHQEKEREWGRKRRQDPKYRAEKVVYARERYRQDPEYRSLKAEEHPKANEEPGVSGQAGGPAQEVEIRHNSN